MDKVDRYAKKIWNYMHMNQTLEKADCILVFGSSDLTPAERACDLFFENYAPVIIFSGNHGMRSIFPEPEAERYAVIAHERGVPKEAVFIENKSLNTGENALFSKMLIERENIPHEKIIIVQKPYMERRVYATFKKVWSEQEIIVTSPQVSYEEYVESHPYHSKEIIINILIGDLQRIKEYPAKGFQIPQEIPVDVIDAYNKLLEMGYNERLIQDL